MNQSLLPCLICVVALATLVLHGCASESEPPRAIVGPVTAYYEIQVSPSTTVGTGTGGEEFAAILFFDNYIILRTDQDQGRILPIHMVKSFRWKAK